MKEMNMLPVKRTFFSNLKEWIRSKIDRNYTLTENSPESLLKNEKLVIRTLNKNPYFIESLPDEMIFQNDTFLKEAINNGYYIKQGSKWKSDIALLSKYIDIKGRLPYLHVIDYKTFENPEFREKFLSQAKKEQLLVSESAPEFLRNDSDLAMLYYRDLMIQNSNKDDIERALKNDRFLTKEVIVNPVFLRDFINLCNTHNVNRQNLLEKILNTPNATSAIKQNPQIIDLLFNELKPEKISSFFEKLEMTDEELDVFFRSDLTGDLAELSKIYEINPVAIETLDINMLGKGIPAFKNQEYACDRKFQEQLLNLSPFKYKLFEKISNRNLSKTNRWNRLDAITLNNISDGYYEELIGDLLKEAENGNRITNEELDTLANIFSASVSGPRLLAEIGLQPDSNNYFNITSKNELKYYNQIKETVCNLIITNTQLEDNEQTRKFSKYLEIFRTMEPIDRIKLAITEKCFGMSLEDASTIMKVFRDISNIESNDKTNENIIEQVKAICNILNCNDLETLQEVGQSVDFVKMDLNQATLLFDEAKEIFENSLKKDLYSPKEEDLIDTVEGIKVYKAPLEFEAITKMSGLEPNKRMWKNSYSKLEHYNNFRRKSCMSFTNGELLNPTEGGLITFGFGQTIKDYQFGGMYTHDAHSLVSSDPVYWQLDEERAKYKDKDNFISETSDKYNEVIVDTLRVDDSLESNKKLMPEYMLYYQKLSNMTEEERNNDLSWQNAMKAAKEFEIPIVVVDCEAVRKNELRKIQEGISQNSSDYKSVKQLVNKIRHYVERYKDQRTYSTPEIDELITREELQEKEKFVEENSPKDTFDTSKYIPGDLTQRIEEKIQELEGAGIGEK